MLTIQMNAKSTTRGDGMASGGFNQVSYWVERHKELRGDHRATGNRSRSPEEMRQRKIYQAYFFACLAQLLRGAALNGDDRAAEVLDIGFGTGFLASILTRTGFIYTGYDLSPVAVEDSLKLAPQANLIVRNIVEEIPQKSDIIFASEVLFHIVDDTQWKAAVRNIASAMKPNSFFVFTETFVETVSDQLPHFKPRTRQAYEELFKECGLRFVPDCATVIQQMPVFTENVNFTRSVHLVKKV
ncbi:class I SAM-dependent methyltransferase [Sinorhizobium medicae]|uniref:Methyltransferase domain-containing protein n=3 Tax=Sinorhizobium medicae TaxID=110321 RepID=A0A6G1WJE9_9HYPH|nr:methyltransferase domain-containing protein [Sinorhizobium medicae]MDX0548994.1 methyltransferase domain-containing protein [Sinorhizobium medicae]MDX0555156.1 methyltransferase domain-containing protein [Sinorhizobium medicae]MDX0573601.1 methyltransferase domain-containing protein [Sinorhizobium medicae]MDX0672486.1 methyltransferase domain-containing protein [Sinorhizobium medicae]